MNDPRLLTLQNGLASLRLAASLPTQARLLDYLDLLLKWNQHFNLTAIRDIDAMLIQHLLDCLAVLPSIDRHVQALHDGPGSEDSHAGRAAPKCDACVGTQRSELRILDVGSGAGLPGVVLAAMRVHWSVTCVDSVAKKAGFVRQVAAELSLPNLHARHSRVEHLKGPAFDLIVSRAFASLADFVDCTRAQLTSAGCWAAMKGSVPSDEIAELPPDIAVFHVEPIDVPGLLAQRCLIWMRRRVEPQHHPAVDPTGRRPVRAPRQV